MTLYHGDVVDITPAEMATYRNAPPEVRAEIDRRVESRRRECTEPCTYSRSKLCDWCDWGCAHG